MFFSNNTKHTADNPKDKKKHFISYISVKDVSFLRTGQLTDNHHVCAWLWRYPLFSYWILKLFSDVFGCPWWMCFCLVWLCFLYLSFLCFSLSLLKSSLSCKRDLDINEITWLKVINFTVALLSMTWSIVRFIVMFFKWPWPLSSHNPTVR